MNKALLALVLAMPVMASANTITFLGEVSDSTCDINVNNTTGDSVIQLQTVAASDLDAASKTAGEREFSFNVSGCTEATQEKVGVRLIAPVVHSTSGNLENIAAVNPATNVTIQILEKTAAINFTNGQHTSELKELDASSTLTFPFTAKYFATGKATPGNVEAKLEYALTYN